MAINADTQLIIDKIKRLSNMATDTPAKTDTDIALMMKDTFDKIASDTGAPILSFADETSFEILPAEWITGSNNSDIRELICLCVIMNYTEVKSEDAQSKAVAVKSGRDMVDTHFAAAGLNKIFENRERKYLKKVNDVINRISTGALCTIRDSRAITYNNNNFLPSR